MITLLRVLPLALLLLLTGGLGDVQAQRSWPNDNSGIPAPPCTIYDPIANTISFCSGATPLPTTTGTGGAPGSGTTSGTSTTGFGKAWYPSTISGNTANGEQMIGLFVDDITVAIFRRSTTCGNCLQIAISQDGGITGTFVSTTATLGNSISAAHRVPSSTPRFLVSSIGGPLNILQSPSLTGTWTAVGGLANPITSWASNTTGSVVLSSDTTGAICKSTDNGISFGSCVAGGGNGILAYAGGTTWLVTNGTAVRRSINDGASWANVLTSASTFTSVICFATTYTSCVAADNGGTITRSSDTGATWPIVADTGLGSPSQPVLCDYGSGVAAGINLRAAPVGFAAITTDAHSTLNSGVTWFPGSRFGSAWDGTGTPSGAITCRVGRGWVGLNVSGGGAQIFAEYNPVTAPGGTLQSSAGGYTVSALIQSGILLNAAPATSVANTAQTVTLTGIAGSRICIREIAVFSSAAGTPTLVIQDATVTQVNYGTLATGTAALRFAGSPLFCGQTSDSVQVVVGAAGAAVTTTVSVVADRYPN